MLSGGILWREVHCLMEIVLPGDVFGVRTGDEFDGMSRGTECSIGRCDCVSHFEGKLSTNWESFDGKLLVGIESSMEF